MTSDMKHQWVPCDRILFKNSILFYRESYNLEANSYVQKSVDVDWISEALRSLGRYGLVLNQPLTNERSVR